MKIEIYSTGGGFYIAQTKLSGGEIATIDNDFLLCLTVYKNEDFTEENMIFSKGLEDLDTEEIEIYDKLYQSLKSYLAKRNIYINIDYDINKGYFVK